jgi:hypothetical protein
VLGLAAPHVHLEERGVAVAPLAVLLDPLGHGHAQVGDGGPGVGEAESGSWTRLPGNAGEGFKPAGPEYGTSGAVEG